MHFSYTCLPGWQAQARYEIVRNSLRYRYQQYLGHNENLEENSLWNIEIVNYGPLYCIATTCHRIGKIVNETSYRVAKSSQSFTESSCLVAESSCHRIGQLTNCPVSCLLAYVKDRLVICNEEDTDGRAISHEMIYHYKCRSLRYSYIFTNSFNWRA